MFIASRFVYTLAVPDSGGFTGDQFVVLYRAEYNAGNKTQYRGNDHAFHTEMEHLYKDDRQRDVEQCSKQRLYRLEPDLARSIEKDRIRRHDEREHKEDGHANRQ